MADINKTDVKVYKPQILDDTDEGGGAMTGHEVVNGAVNNLFPDISRLDRTAGRVSMRKAFLYVDTDNQAVFYGAHSILVQDASDPLVSLCFFTTEDWFDRRTEARKRIESYLVKGTSIGATLWGHHYYGSKIAKMATPPTWEDPSIGDVIIFETSHDLGGATIPTVSQYIRITDVSSEIKEFVIEQGSSFFTFKKKIVTIKFGQPLEYDFPGSDVQATTNFATNQTTIFSSVAADASVYYGVSKLAEAAEVDDMSIVVEDIKTHIVPSAQSETGVTNYAIGKSVSPVLSSSGAPPMTRTISFTFSPGNILIIGEGVVPSSLSIASLNVTDDGDGNVRNSSGNIGSIDYGSGTIAWGSGASGGSVSAAVTYTPSCSSSILGRNGAQFINVNNRGLIYTFVCNPLPLLGTTKVEYISGGKWYTIWDHGSGHLYGSSPEVGTGIVNPDTGDLSISLVSPPDVGSYILYTWGDSKAFIDLEGEDTNFSYDFYLEDEGVVPDSFTMTWSQNSLTHTVYDDTNGNLHHTNGTVITNNIGKINFTSGRVKITSLPITPPANMQFSFNYQHRPIITETFLAPTRVGGNVVLNLTNEAAVVPRTFHVSFPVLANHAGVGVNQALQGPLTPTVEVVDGANNRLDFTDIKTTDFIPATLVYTANGSLTFNPDVYYHFANITYGYGSTVINT